jgi:ribosomal protein S14
VYLDADTMVSKTPSSPHGQSEHCERCGRDTQHAVDVEIRAESTDGEHVAFSREPYRVATCVVCGTERAQRMNNA